MRRRRGGFTFLEIIVVVAILAILATLIVPRFVGRVEETRVSQAEVQMKEIAKALELYRLDNSRYPTSEQGLKALVEKPTTEPAPTRWKQYMDTMPKDPWDNDYVYLAPGAKSPFEIISQGPDGRASEDDLRHPPAATASPRP